MAYSQKALGAKSFKALSLILNMFSYGTSAFDFYDKTPHLPIVSKCYVLVGASGMST